MLHSYKYAEKKFDHAGVIIKVKRGLAWSTPLKGVVVGEIVAFEDGGHGRVSAIEKTTVEIMVFSKNSVDLGTSVVRTGQILHVTLGDDLLGHTLDSFGHGFFDQRPNNPDDSLQSAPVEKPAPGIMQRKAIDTQLQTGVLAVDLTVPLGKGQRELVIGDRKTGKSFFVLQTALTQAKLGSIIVYCLIGKRDSEIKQVENWFKEQGISQNSVLVVSDASASSGEIFMTPYTAITIAEYFCSKNKDVVLILDDLSRHATSYREMSLLGGRFPGRDSYPGDIFYVHSRLLERAGSFVGGGTITALPIVETVEGDITGYLQTNLMSMTDGHLYFDNELYAGGSRPAINLFLSVTRVGKQTQLGLAKEISHVVVTTLKKYEELQRFLRFGSELSDSIQETVRLARGLNELFHQIQITLSDPIWQYVKIAWLLNGVSIEDIQGRDPNNYQELISKGKTVNSLAEWKQLCGQ